jgi:hypothetical protein
VQCFVLLVVVRHVQGRRVGARVPCRGCVGWLVGVVTVAGDDPQTQGLIFAEGLSRQQAR